MLNWLLRYQPVVEMVRELQPTTVLDVGSGVYGLSWYWEGPVVQTDLAFPTAATFAADARGGTRVGAAQLLHSTAEQLPFRDQAFAVVVSLDMFEHLPEGLRQGAAEELFRVADRAVVVGYPEGRAAAALDRALAMALRLLPRAQVPGWLQEHLAQAAYPDERTVRAVLPSGWRLHRTVRSGNLLAQFLFVLAEMLPLLGRGTALLERRWHGRGRSPGWVDTWPTYRTVYLFVREDALERLDDPVPSHR